MVFWDPANIGFCRKHHDKSKVSLMNQCVFSVALAPLFSHGYMSQVECTLSFKKILEDIRSSCVLIVKLNVEFLKFASIQ